MGRAGGRHARQGCYMAAARSAVAQRVDAPHGKEAHGDQQQPKNCADPFARQGGVRRENIHHRVLNHDYVADQAEEHRDPDGHVACELCVLGHAPREHLQQRTEVELPESRRGEGGAWLVSRE